MPVPPRPPRPSKPDAAELAAARVADEAAAARAAEEAVAREERSVSHTRRLGSNAQAAFELTSSGDALQIVDLSEIAVPEVDPARDYAPGDVIAGKYRLSKIIGRGGMGAVWQAHNIPLDIDIAIKLIRRDRTAPEAAVRLLQEARAAARLKHPSIVRVSDFGETDTGDPFIAMELLHGEPLGTILRRKGRLSPAVAVQTLLPVASALVSAHGKGIVHRDLKPDNILIVTDESGTLLPKVVDFGIAKLLLSNDVDRQVTMAGEVLGSPDYMSPEQARGADNVGEATDVWAFSVLLYEAVSGKRPFDGPNYNSLIAAILTAPPERLPPQLIDSGLWSIIERGLAKEIADRWPKMRDMGAALASWAVDRGLEDDLAGNSISKQWLSGAAKRLLTVMPENEDAPPAVLPPPPPGAPPVDNVNAAIPLPPPPLLPSQTGWHPAARRRRSRGIAWMVALISIGGLGLAGWLARDQVMELVPWPLASATATATTAADATAAATATAAAIATVVPEPSAADAASAAPAASASAPPAGSAKPIARPWKKPKGPSVPKHIKF